MDAIFFNFLLGRDHIDKDNIFYYMNITHNSPHTQSHW